MTYLPKREDLTTDTPTAADFAKFLPRERVLSEWQSVIRANMIELFEQQRAGYQWDAAAGDGCVNTHYHPITDSLLMKSKDVTYCCGVTLELYWLALVDYFGMLGAKELIPTYKDFQQMRAWWFCYDAKNWTGGAGGVVIALQDALSKRARAADRDIPFRFQYHTDLYNAEFGAQLQLQPNEDPMSAGHSAIFIGLEKRVWSDGKEYDAFRVFESNNNQGYGFKPGVKINWYWVEKENKNKFQRVVHVGQLI